MHTENTKPSKIVSEKSQSRAGIDSKINKGKNSGLLNMEPKFKHSVM